MFFSRYSKHFAASVKAFSTLAIRVAANRQVSKFAIEVLEGDKFQVAQLDVNIQQLLSKTLIETSKMTIVPGEINQWIPFIIPTGSNVAIEAVYENKVYNYFGHSSDPEHVFFWLIVGVQEAVKIMLPGSTSAGLLVDHDSNPLD